MDCTRITTLWQSTFNSTSLDLGGIELRPDRRAELGLDHPDGRFDVAPFVVVAEEVVTVEVVVVPHLRPERIPPAPGGPLLEGDEGGPPVASTARKFRLLL